MGPSAHPQWLTHTNQLIMLVILMGGREQTENTYQIEEIWSNLECLSLLGDLPAYLVLYTTWA